MGWVVAEQNVYVDDGISGAEFDRRPGFLRLMNAVKARPVPFQVLVMSEESRLGREQIETGYALVLGAPGERMAPARRPGASHRGRGAVARGPRADRWVREVYLRAAGPSRWGRPISGIESPYLLTGFLECACCHGSMTVASYDWKTHRRHAYACGYNRFRGRSVCDNGLWAPMDRTDGAVLDTIAEELLCPQAIEEGIRKAVEALQPSPGTVESRRAVLRRELQDVAEKTARLTAAVEDGGDVPALLAERDAGASWRWRSLVSTA